MTYETTTFTKTSIIGIQIKTTNKDGKAMEDIPKLWEKFFSENIIEKIPAKTNNRIFAIYSDYKGGIEDPYTVTIGCEVSDTNSIPEDLKALTIEENPFAIFTAQGKRKDAVIETWQKIWKSDLDRKYAHDFEVYDEKSQDPNNSTVKIYVGLNS